MMRNLPFVLMFAGLALFCAGNLMRPNAGFSVVYAVLLFVSVAMIAVCLVLK